MIGTDRYGRNGGKLCVPPVTGLRRLYKDDDTESGRCVLIPGPEYGRRDRSPFAAFELAMLVYRYLLTERLGGESQQHQ
jgi:hypothetical protein